MERNGVEVITIKRDPEKGFDFDFDICIPADVREDAGLFLSFSNSFWERQQVLTSQMRAPVMIPYTENIDNLNFDQFEYGALVQENGSIRPYGTIDTGLIEQYKKAIEEAYRILKEKEVIRKDKEEKVDVEGYSYHGVRAQRFAMLMPEKIRSVFVGGAYSSIPLPVENFDGMDLEYPIGFKNVEKIVGEENTDRVLADYKDVVQVVYATEQELKYDGSFSINGNRMRDTEGNRTSYLEPTVSQHDISPDVVDIVIAQIKLLGKDINDRANGAIELIRQNGCALRKTKIYEGVDHRWSVESKKLDSLIDMVKAVESMDRASSKGEFNPHETEIEGFVGGVEKIDLSYEQRRDSLQRMILGDGITKEDFISASNALIRNMVRIPEDDAYLYSFPNKFMYDFSADQVAIERALRDLEYVDVVDTKPTFGYHFTSKNNIGKIFEQGILAKKGDNSSGKMGKEAINKSFLSYGEEGVLQIFNRTALAASELKLKDIRVSKTHRDFIPEFTEARDGEEKLSILEGFELVRKYMSDNIYFVFDTKISEYVRNDVTDVDLKNFNENNLRTYMMKNQEGKDVSIYDEIKRKDDEIKAKEKELADGSIQEEKKEEIKAKIKDLKRERSELSIRLRQESKKGIDALRGDLISDEGASIDRIDYDEDKCKWTDQVREPHNVHTRIVEDEKGLHGVIISPKSVLSVDGKTPASGVQAMKELYKKTTPDMAFAIPGEDPMILDLFFEYVDKVDSYAKAGLIGYKAGEPVMDLSDISRYPGLEDLNRRLESRCEEFKKAKNDAQNNSEINLEGQGKKSAVREKDDIGATITGINNAQQAIGESLLRKGDNSKKAEDEKNI